MVEKVMPKILVVDDEPQNVELLDAYLALDYDVIEAYSGDEALLKIKDELPDIILLDVMMPRMNGYDVCKALKSDPKTQFIPVILVTALSGVDDRIQGSEAGADEFLTKPVNKLELITRVKSLLRVKQLHDSLLAERDRLDMQNRIRRVLVGIIPTIFQTLLPEQKRIVIHQMVAMVEKTILEKYGTTNKDINLDNVGDVCCDLMNQLGGSFSLGPKEDEYVCTIIGHTCPWGIEEARRNPVLCNLTRGIFTRFAARASEDAELETIKTIGNGDDCCFFKLKAG